MLVLPHRDQSFYKKQKEEEEDGRRRKTQLPFKRRLSRRRRERGRDFLLKNWERRRWRIRGRGRGAERDEEEEKKSLGERGVLTREKEKECFEEVYLSCWFIFLTPSSSCRCKEKSDKNQEVEKKDKGRKRQRRSSCWEAVISVDSSILLAFEKRKKNHSVLRGREKKNSKKPLNHHTDVCVRTPRLSSYF